MSPGGRDSDGAAMKSSSASEESGGDEDCLVASGLLIFLTDQVENGMTLVDGWAEVWADGWRLDPDENGKHSKKKGLAASQRKVVLELVHKDHHDSEEDAQDMQLPAMLRLSSAKAALKLLSVLQAAPRVEAVIDAVWRSKDGALDLVLVVEAGAGVGEDRGRPGFVFDAWVIAKEKQANVVKEAVLDLTMPDPRAIKHNDQEQVAKKNTQETQASPVAEVNFRPIGARKEPIGQEADDPTKFACESENFTHDHPKKTTADVSSKPSTPAPIHDPVSRGIQEQTSKAPLKEKANKTPSPTKMKDLVPFFNEEERRNLDSGISRERTMSDGNAIKTERQEEGQVRILLGDDRQWIMLEDRLEELEYDSGSRLCVTAPTCKGKSEFRGEGLLVVATGGDVLGALNLLLDQALSDMEHRKEKIYLVVDADAASKIRDEIPNWTGIQGAAELSLIRAEKLPFDVVKLVLPTDWIVEIRGAKPAVVRRALDSAAVACNAYESLGRRVSPQASNVTDHRTSSPVPANLLPGLMGASPPPPRQQRACSAPGSLPVGPHFISARLLVPNMWSRGVLTPDFKNYMVQCAGVHFFLQPMQNIYGVKVFPLVVMGRCRSVREAVCTVFKTVVDDFFCGNLEAVQLDVQFKVLEMLPQDVWSFEGVASRCGCIQSSGSGREDVTFRGALPNILAAMSYMCNFAL